jgi:hypothetical protein
MNNLLNNQQLVDVGVGQGPGQYVVINSTGFASEASLLCAPGAATGLNEICILKAEQVSTHSEATLVCAL